MKILILGATGRTGKILLKKAIDDKHEVSVIVRDLSKVEGFNAGIIKGSPYDLETMMTAFKGCEAVIGTLNISRISDNPWAKLRSPEDTISRSYKNALMAMKENNVKRIITMSALGAGDSKKKMPFLFNAFIAMTNLKYAFADHTRQEELLARSDADWTVVRLPMLTMEPGEKEIVVNKNDGVKLKSKINRESVARFMLSILKEEEYYQKIVGISYM